MKTFVQPAAKILIGALVFVSSLAVGQGGDPDKKSFAVAMYPAADASKVWMSVEKNNTDRRLQVEMLDDKRQIVYSGVVSKKTKAFHQRFDLSQIKDGYYTFRISDGVESTERSFRLSTPGVQEALPQRMITMK
ncbi:hypothetical protein GCM10023189_01530 [Nibrella saemangeumensis]|uniref:Por secretion system C-terminal sorting domain-containing protein n=1 Tax=Nibrella saemangeumensis TaxID=1084526 RepID=A0ABP8MB37_9BACT